MKITLTEAMVANKSLGARVERQAAEIRLLREKCRALDNQARALHSRARQQILDTYTEVVKMIVAQTAEIRLLRERCRALILPQAPLTLDQRVTTLEAWRVKISEPTRC